MQDPGVDRADGDAQKEDADAELDEHHGDDPNAYRDGLPLDAHRVSAYYYHYHLFDVCGG